MINKNPARANWRARDFCLIMKHLLYALKLSLAVYFGLIVVLFFALLYPAFLFALSNPKRYKYANRVIRFGTNCTFFIAGVRLKQIMEVPLDKQKTYVITPNHTSKLDILTLASKLDLDFNFMAKKEFGDVPLFGIFFRTRDIPVDRKNIQNSAVAYQRAKRQLINKERSIVMYPQGTIPNTTPRMSRFYDGAFKLAIETQTDILPVTLIGNWKVLPDFGDFHFMPGKLVQYVHKPISTQGMTEKDLPALKQKVFDIITAKLAEYGY